MNKIFKYIASFVALVSGLAVYAQNLPSGVYREENGVAYAKRAVINNDGTYTIDLETFVTGEVTQTFESVPVDVVLVLDVSGSMDEAISSTQSYVEAHVTALYGDDYDNYSPTSYYYKYNDNYYPLYIGRGGYPGNRRYYLFFIDNTYTTRYINTSGQVVNDQPTNVTNANTNLLNSNVVQLYTAQTITVTKMDALKTAVKAFIEQIAHNDLYEDDTDDNPRGHALGNQISIVKFGSATYNGSTTDATITPGNHFNHLVYQRQGGWGGGGWYQTLSEYTTDYQVPIETSNRQEIWYNCSEVLSGFTPTAATSDVNSLKGAVDNLVSSGATAADYGMNLAYMLINTLGEDRANSNKVVVFFTDGAPTHASDYDANVASDAIGYSNSIKAITYGEGDDATHPTVYSVGIFTGSVATNVNTFMTNIATDVNHYFNASSGTAEDLKNIFTAIAHSSGGSGNTQVTGQSTLTVDVVSSSFSVPKGFEQNPANAVEVLVAPCTGITTIDGHDYLTFGQAKAPTAYGLPAITPSIVEADNTVSTTGFNYSDNWCGFDQSANKYHGYKQIIRFVITVNDDAVGGPAVETNTSGSGIYLPGSDEPLVEFNIPTVKLPVQIWIQKVGLMQGDNAVFTLARTPFVENFDPETAVWQDWGTKIVVGPDDYDPVKGIYLKKQVGLNPDYYYRIKEDAWAFGYTYQYGGIQYTFGDDIQNPFVFTNTPNNKKYDESSVRNTFKERTN
jgi:hypothetical protein